MTICRTGSLISPTRGREHAILLIVVLDIRQFRFVWQICGVYLYDSVASEDDSLREGWWVVSWPWTGVWSQSRRCGGLPCPIFPRVRRGSEDKVMILKDKLEARLWNLEFWEVLSEQRLGNSDFGARSEARLGSLDFGETHSEATFQNSDFWDARLESELRNLDFRKAHSGGKAPNIKLPLSKTFWMRL